MIPCYKQKEKKKHWGLSKRRKQGRVAQLWQVLKWQIQFELNCYHVFTFSSPVVHILSFLFKIISLVSLRMKSIFCFQWAATPKGDENEKQNMFGSSFSGTKCWLNNGKWMYRYKQHCIAYSVNNPSHYYTKVNCLLFKPRGYGLNFLSFDSRNRFPRDWLGSLNICL